MNDKYPSNSKNPKPEIKAVISGTASVKPISAGDKIKNVLWGPYVKRAVAGIVVGVVVPALKDMASDAFDQMLYGQRRGGSARPVNSGQKNYVNYGGYSKDRPANRQTVQQEAPGLRTAKSSRDYVVDSRADAELFMSNVRDVVEQFGSISVHDVLQMLGMKGNYTDTDYGWYSDVIGDISVRPWRDDSGITKYVIQMPPISPIE